VVTIPLILLAIPSVLIGALTAGPMLRDGFFAGAMDTAPQHDAMAAWAEEYPGWVHFALDNILAPPFLLAFAGFALATAMYLVWPDLHHRARRFFALPVRILENKYGFDAFNEKVLAAGGRLLGKVFWKVGDQGIIDGVAVNGSASTIGLIASVVRRVQSGFLYSYAFWMVIGLAVMLGWFLTHR
jgi:NADH-quinone oxidoreductase subunit L